MEKSSALVMESPLAQSVTSWPRRNELLAQHADDGLRAAVGRRRHRLRKSRHLENSHIRTSFLGQSIQLLG